MREYRAREASRRKAHAQAVLQRHRDLSARGYGLSADEVEEANRVRAS
jgi:hypothetical protein